jgi:hypothetical protein
VTPVLAASTLIVMGDVVEDSVDLDGKDVILSYPIVGHHGKNGMNYKFRRGISSSVRNLKCS